MDDAIRARMQEIIDGDPVQRDCLEREALLQDAESIIRCTWACDRQYYREDDAEMTRIRTWMRIYHKDPTITDACTRCEGTGKRWMAGRYRKHQHCGGTGYLTNGNVDRECFCGEDDPDELVENGEGGWICHEHERLVDYAERYREAEADYLLSLPESER